MSTNLKSHACMLTVCICVCVCETERGGENQLSRECSGTAYWCWVSVPIRSAFSVITDVYFCDEAGVLIIIPAKILHL